MGLLVSAAEGLESLGNSIRDGVRGGISNIFSGSQRSTNNVNSGPMSSSIRPQARPTGGISGLSTRDWIDSSRRASDRRGSRNATPASDPASTGAGAYGFNMPAEAAAGSFVQPLNPAYDATDPMSARYASRPSYEQLVAYRNTPSPHVNEMLPGTKFATGMAEGGEIAPEGGNAVIDAAVNAVRGVLTGQAAAVALAKFVEAYGQAELKKLVAAVTPAMQEQAKEGGGEVEGPGTGKSDSVPAKNGQQPYALSDGEYIMPVEVVDGLGGGDHEKGVAALDRLREMAQEGRPREKAMDPSA